MAERDRPRLNLTLDSEVKSQIRRVADDLGIPVSRLIEEVLREFLTSYEDDPMIGRRISKQVQDRKRQSEDDGPDSEAIRNILDRMDQLE